MRVMTVFCLPIKRVAQMRTRRQNVRLGKKSETLGAVPSF